jgi:guanylate kinase
MVPKGKMIILSAPSGSGKTTLVREVMKDPSLNLAFSVSATSRPKRPYEEDGVHYYFLTPEAFRRKIREDAFVEWEEVYPGHYYGTLKSEVERLLNEGKNVIFDIDVKGGMNIKRMYPGRSLSIFVQAPGLKELEKRLRERNTETEEKLQMRLAKAREEWQMAPLFDYILINDDKERAVAELTGLIHSFIQSDTNGKQKT